MPRKAGCANLFSRAAQTGCHNTHAASAKGQFSKEVSAELDRYPQLTHAEKIELNAVISNKIQGDIHPKEDYLIFFSHSKVDKLFAHFIYNVLLQQGVHKEEMFYTSRDDNPQKYEDITPLKETIHKCITNTSNMIFYLIGPKYKSSEYCMFEGGAGWATRSVGDYPVMAIKYEHIPKFLTNGKNEFSVYDGKSISLSRDNYTALVSLINRLIGHVNVGRQMKSEPEVPLITETTLPSELELFKKGETFEQYMNTTIKDCWACFVEKDLQTYMKEVLKKKK